MKLLPLLAFLLAACGPGSSDDASSDDPVDDGPSRVHLYAGHGGIGPDGWYGDVVYERLADAYRDADAEVTYDDEWPDPMPDSLHLLLPSSTLYGATPFSGDEVDQLIGMLEDGGQLVIVNDHSLSQDHAPINALMADLGLDGVMSGGYGPYGVESTRIADHPLGDGVETLRSDGPGMFDAGDDLCLAPWTDGCLVAVADVHGGQVLVFGDSQLLDDAYLDSHVEQGADNDRFLANLVDSLP